MVEELKQETALKQVIHVVHQENVVMMTALAVQLTKLKLVMNKHVADIIGVFLVKQDVLVRHFGYHAHVTMVQILSG